MTRDSDTHPTGGDALAAREEWRPIGGYESLYSVSNFGAVRSVRNGRHMSPVLNSDGYETVKLHRAGVGTRFRINRLVCETFNGAGDTTWDAAHLDGNRRNNRADNLKWATRRENLAHKLSHGTHQAGERGGNAKLTAAQAEDIRARAERGESYRSIGRVMGVSSAQVSRIINGQRWSMKSEGGPQ